MVILPVVHAEGSWAWLVPGVGQELGRRKDGAPLRGASRSLGRLTQRMEM